MKVLALLLACSAALSGCDGASSRRASAEVFAWSTAECDDNSFRHQTRTEGTTVTFTASCERRKN